MSLQVICRLGTCRFHARSSNDPSNGYQTIWTMEELTFSESFSSKWLSRFMLIDFVFFTVPAGNKGSDPSPWTHPQAGGQRGYRLRLLPSASLEAGRGGPQSAALYMGREWVVHRMHTRVIGNGGLQSWHKRNWEWWYAVLTLEYWQRQWFPKCTNF